MSAESLQSYTVEMGGVPLLIVSRGAPVDAARRGTLLVVHGLGASKEVNRPELERFADAGFLAIGLDAVGHGERRYPDFEERFALWSPHREQAMIDTVVATVHELPGLIDLLEGAALSHPGGLGLCGVSFGGFVGYGAAPSGRLNALVALIASPLWRMDIPENPARNVDRFYPCAVLSQVAGRDELVDPNQALEFHRQLEPSYAREPELLSFIEYPESAHFMRQEDWNAALDRAIEWFRRFLV
ncbi:MAG: dienelactone hydrolase family protein [Myxococcaceae bacterium]